MQAIVSAHLKAEGLGDIDGTVAVYTDDIEHDAVGFRAARAAARLRPASSISFRILHVFEFRSGLISRENVWLDTAAIVAQLS
jgi:hypothetical protein